MKSMTSITIKVGLTAVLIGQGALVATSVLAQEPQARGIDEIVVTARRREESLQTTPVAVTAVTEQMLRLKQIEDVADIQRTTPNLGITQGATAGSRFVYVSLRGQQNLQSGIGNDPAVGIYVDGVYMARPSTGVFDLNDINRVEVLRGPQGTLFGRNTIGGAINVVTHEPTDRLEGKVTVEVGEYDTRNISGILNIPVNDRLAVRLAGHHKERDGFGDFVLLDREASDLDRDDFVRMRLSYDISDDWQLGFSADWNEVQDGGILNGLRDWRDSTGLLGLFGIDLDPYLHTSGNWYKSFSGEATDVDPAYTPSSFVRTYGYGLTVEGNLKWADFQSITAWRSTSSESFQDLDATPVGLLSSLSSFKTENISQEFQLSGGKGALSWTGGLFYFREIGEEISEFRAFGFLGTPFGENNGDVENISYAAYLQTYYDVTDKLRAVAGVRYTYDERNAVLHNKNVVGDPSTCNVAFPDGGTFPPCDQTLEENFEYPSWLLGFDYQLSNDIFLYAKTSGASMAGGWNLRLLTVPAFDPQDVIDLEVGAKADWWDGRLRTNVALFHMWQKDVQRNVAAVVDGRSTQFVRNAGDSQISGLEFEGTLVPWQGMEITASVGLMRGSYDDGTYTEQQSVIGTGSAPGGCSLLGIGPTPGTSEFSCRVDRSDEELLQLPEITYSIGVTQAWPFSFGEFQLHLDYAYIDDQTFYEQTPAAQQPDAVKQVFARANDLGRQDGYGLFNAQATLRLNDPSVTLSVWGRNLTDKEYVHMNFSELYIDLGSALSYVGDPRMVGITLTYEF